MPKFETHNGKHHVSNKSEKGHSKDSPENHDGSHMISRENFPTGDDDKTVMSEVKVDWDMIDTVSSKHGTAYKYEATVHHNGESEKFEFTDSINAYNQGEEPKDKDLMYALIMEFSSATMDKEEFFEEFGYDEDSMKAHKIFDQVVANGHKMRTLFTQEDIEKLQEEFQDY